MRAKTLQIYWHDKEPVFSIDFDPIITTRFASCGGDTYIRIWNLEKEGGVKYLSTLARHSSGVNCVRWSPVISILASAGDDGTILVWEQSTKEQHTNLLGEEEDECLEHWNLKCSLRGSNQDVYDLAWSPDGSKIAAGGMDGSIRIFDVSEHKVIFVLADHSHFIQGIAWDPLGEYIASQSNDRAVHIYKLNGSLESSKNTPKLIAKHSKSVNDQTKKSFRLYHDEEVNSFFRRLSFCPDGSYLVTPTALSPCVRDSTETPEKDLTSNTVYMYSRGLIDSAPVKHLPGHKKPAIAVRFSPIKYELIPFEEPVQTEQKLDFIENVTEIPSSLMNVDCKTHSTECTGDIDEPDVMLIAENEISKGEVDSKDNGSKANEDGLRRSSFRESLRKNYNEPSSDDENPNTLSNILQPPSLVTNNDSDMKKKSLPLPYRYTYAVATLDSVAIYSTQKQHTKPIAFLSNLHYAPFTDMAWNSEGTVLLLSSTDGFCTIVDFKQGELGAPYQSNEKESKQSVEADMPVMAENVPEKPEQATPVNFVALENKKRIQPVFIRK